MNVLSTHSAWLYSSLVLGCNGLLSGSGSVIADLQSALFEAVKADDMKRAPSSFIRFGKRNGPADDDLSALDRIQQRNAVRALQEQLLRAQRIAYGNQQMRNLDRHTVMAGRPRRNMLYLARLPASKRLLARNFIRLGKRSTENSMHDSRNDNGQKVKVHQGNAMPANLTF